MKQIEKKGGQIVENSQNQFSSTAELQKLSKQAHFITSPMQLNF